MSGPEFAIPSVLMFNTELFYVHIVTDIYKSYKTLNLSILQQSCFKMYDINLVSTYSKNSESNDCNLIRFWFELQ